MAGQHKQASNQSKEAESKARKPKPTSQGPASLIEQADPLQLQQAMTHPETARPADILALQRTAGNRAVGRVIQAKLKVGPAGDQYEQEADRMADQVTSQPAPATEAPAVQRQEEEEELQMKPIAPRQAGDAFEAEEEVERRLTGLQGKGSPLPEEVRSDMERRFGADFGQVRVHTDNDAAELNQELQAKAFTHGSDIYFDAGNYDPGSSTGKRLLAHELTHIVQQGGDKIGHTRGAHPQVRTADANVVQRHYWDQVGLTEEEWNKKSPKERAELINSIIEPKTKAPPKQEKKPETTETKQSKSGSLEFEKVPLGEDPLSKMLVESKQEKKPETTKTKPSKSKSLESEKVSLGDDPLSKMLVESEQEKKPETTKTKPSESKSLESENVLVVEDPPSKPLTESEKGNEKGQSKSKSLEFEKVPLGEDPLSKMLAESEQEKKQEKKQETIETQQPPPQSKQDVQDTTNKGKGKGKSKRSWWPFSKKKPTKKKEPTEIEMTTFSSKTTKTSEEKSSILPEISSLKGTTEKSTKEEKKDNEDSNSPLAPQDKHEQFLAWEPEKKEDTSGEKKGTLESMFGAWTGGMMGGMMGSMMMAMMGQGKSQTPSTPQGQTDPGLMNDILESVHALAARVTKLEEKIK